MLTCDHPGRCRCVQETAWIEAFTTMTGRTESAGRALFMYFLCVRDAIGVDGRQLFEEPELVFGGSQFVNGNGSEHFGF